MKELYRLAGLLFRSGVVTRPCAPRRCLPFFRFPNSANANALVYLSLRIAVTECRYLSTEISLKENSSYIMSNHKCDKGIATSSDADVDSVVEQSDSLEEESHKTEIDLSAISPALPTKSFSLAAYVNDSETLRNLVMLGVNLSKIEEKDISLAEKLVKLDFEHDVKPVLLFLHHCDIKDCDIGECITRNPYLLCEPIDDMEVRVNYLASKRFSKETVAVIISKAPGVLTATTKETDAQLGYLQQDFMLSGNCIVYIVYEWLSFLVARVIDLQLNGREFISHRQLALLGSSLGQVITPTGLTHRSGLVLAYLAAGEKPPSLRL